jgi:hypothetical protein
MLGTTEPLTEREITTPVDLCDSSGNLNRDAIGWSREPLHRSNVRGHLLRKKRWNYWAVTSDRYLFSATVADIDYMGLAFVYFLDFETHRFIEKTVSVPFARLPMPEAVYEDVRFRHKRLRVTLKDDGANARITAKAHSFAGQPMRAEIDVGRPAGHEMLNVVIPWSQNRFQFTSKQNTLPASGFVEIGGERYEFEKGKSWAVLDYGRGVWRYETFWNWGAASGVQNGHTVGLNLGGGWTDGTGMTENGACIDGRLHKIHDDLAFNYDSSDFMRPWTVQTRASGLVNLKFEPFFERVAKTDLLILKSEVHQVFGRYKGSIAAADGTRYEISDLLGWVEQHNARW